MPKLTSKQKSQLAIMVMIVAAAAFIVADTVNGTDKQKGNTFSEWFWRLPEWFRTYLIFTGGAVANHLFFGWNSPSVNVQGDVNVEVREESK